MQATDQKSLPRGEEKTVINRDDKSCVQERGAGQAEQKSETGPGK